MNFRLKKAAVAMGLCVLSMTAAVARPAPQVTVAYGDLDLRSEVGARVLLARLEGAAVRACGGRADIRDLPRTAQFHICTEEAVAAAVGRLGVPMVNLVYARQGQRVATRQ